MGKWDSYVIEETPKSQDKWSSYEVKTEQPIEEKSNIIKNALLDLQRPGAVIRAPIQNILKKISGISGEISHQQAVEQPQTVPQFENLLPELAGQQKPAQTESEAFVRGLISAATPTGIQGTLSGAGKTLDIATDPTQIIPILLGLKNPKVISKTGEITRDIGEKFTPKPIKQIGREFKKVGTKIKEGELFTPETKIIEEKIGRLKNIAKEDYKSRIKAQEQNLKDEINNITKNISKNIEKLEQTKTTLSEKSSVEAARKSWEFKKEASESYGRAENLIANNIEKQGGITRQAIQDKVINPARAEIDKDLITKGKPLAFFDDLEAKYGSGISEETNPEARAVAKSLGLKKGQLKNAGIDWSKVAKESQFQPTSGNETINIKEAFKDARDIHETMSAIAKGEKALATPEDRAATIYLKHWNKFMEEVSPEHRALQQAYKPIIEQKEFIGKTFEPGSVYGREKGAEFYRNLIEKGKGGGIGERERLAAIEKGTPGFTKGIGNYSELIKKVQNKIINAEKLGKTLEEKAIKLSENKKAELSDALKNRLSQLEKRKGFGQKEVVDVGRLAKKRVQAQKIRQIAALGGLALGGGYFGKRFIYKILSGGK